MNLLNGFIASMLFIRPTMHRCVQITISWYPHCLIILIFQAMLSVHPHVCLWGCCGARVIVKAHIISVSMLQEQSGGCQPVCR